MPEKLRVFLHRMKIVWAIVIVIALIIGYLWFIVELVYSHPWIGWPLAALSATTYFANPWIDWDDD